MIGQEFYWFDAGQFAERLQRQLPKDEYAEVHCYKTSKPRESLFCCPGGESLPAERKTYDFVRVSPGWVGEKRRTVGIIRHERGFVEVNGQEGDRGYEIFQLELENRVVLRDGRTLDKGGVISISRFEKSDGELDLGRKDYIQGWFGGWEYCDYRTIVPNEWFFRNSSDSVRRELVMAAG